MTPTEQDREHAPEWVKRPARPWLAARVESLTAEFAAVHEALVDKEDEMTEPSERDRELAMEHERKRRRVGITAAERISGLAEAFGAARAAASSAALEEVARLADEEAEMHRLRDDMQRCDACRWLAMKIRALAEKDDR